MSFQIRLIARVSEGNRSSAYPQFRIGSGNHRASGLFMLEGSIRKNHELLFLACRELMSAKRDFSLALVGDGWARPALEKRIAELGLSNHITLIGEQENPAPWIAAADALALTSHFEAFGLVLVEAMICGTPVVSVDCPVGPSDVLGGGNFGMLVDETSPGAFAQAISTLMDSPGLAQQLREKGYERALAFDVKQIVPAWERLIDAQGL